MPYHLSALNQTISLIKAEPALQDTKIMVGGLPFLLNPDLIHSTQADLYAPDAKTGVAQANALL
jgi:methanogenic corrinoid protein MtbC1